MSKIYNLSNRLSRVFAGHSPLTTHHSNQRGAILITMLLLMVIVTLLGVIAINTSTIDIQITGHSKRAALALQGAEAGIDLSIPIIESTLSMGQLSTSTAMVSTTITFPTFPDGSVPTAGLNTTSAPNLGTEITGGANYPNDNDSPTLNTDLSITNLNGVGVNVDIDRFYSYALPGGSIEFAAGYEGVGAGAGGGGVGILYGIDSQGTM